MISGFVLAKPGEKISKSKNNAAGSPFALIENHSADAIRYWAASESQLKISKRFMNKLYNAARFVALQLEDFKKADQYDESKLLPIDRWILQRVSQTTEEVTNLLNHYEIGQARHEIDELFWKDFCDYYIEIVKERLYQPEKHGIEQRYSGQTALYYSLLGILKLYAIYTPYITDYIYQNFYGKYEEKKSLHQTVWSVKQTDKTYIGFGEHVKTVIMNVRKNKTENQLSMKDSVPELIVICPKKYREFYRKTEKDLKACTGAEKIIFRS